MDNGQDGADLEPFVAAPPDPPPPSPLPSPVQPLPPAVGSAEEWVAVCTAFVRDHVARAGAAGVVLGVSGGIDSAVVAHLCVRALGQARVRGLLLPAADSDPQDAADARLVCEGLGIEHREHGIGPAVEALLAALVQGGGRPPDERARGNAKARVRMALLYADAQADGRLVCGTGNKSELLVGYFTKHGDGGVDLQPIGDLYKTQVFDLARHLGVLARVVEKAPSAGLRPGQTDEGDLGMPYAELDRILKGIELNQDPVEIVRRTGLPPAQVERVVRMVRASEHKRHAPLVPKLGARTVGIDWRRSVHWDAA